MNIKDFEYQVSLFSIGCGMLWLTGPLCSFSLQRAQQEIMFLVDERSCQTRLHLFPLASKLSWASYFWHQLSIPLTLVGAMLNICVHTSDGGAPCFFPPYTPQKE